MAAAPPPFSPRDAARQAREYARMQRSQARLQRAQYRAQYAYLRRRPSFVGPVLLITAGVVALLLESGKLDPMNFWPWYAKWWPALLVFIGLGLLAEYFFDRNNPQPGRRSVGGVVWLIILLSLAGAGAHATRNVWPWPDGYWDHIGENGDWFPLLGEQHIETHTLTSPIAPTGTLTIVNARGDVEIAPDGSPSAAEVRVEARQTVHANSDESARNDFNATLPILTATGAGATLDSAGRNGASVDLKVTVPAGIALVVHTTHGDIAISGIRRNVEVNNAHGDVTLDSLGANAHIQMDHGDVTAHDIAGDVAIDGKADDVTVSQVKGRTLLNGDFFGNTRLDQVGSLVHFHSSRTDLDVPRLGGEMTLDSGGLRLVNPSGGVRLSTRSKDIEITGLSGDAHIENNNGDVDLTAALPLGNLDVNDHTGSITVSVPSNASFSVHGSTGSNDEITTEFPLSNQTGSGRRTLTGQVGQGGPHLELETNHGDLALHKGGSEAPDRPELRERSEAPEKPERPDHPDRPERHLHPTAEAPPPRPTVQ